MLTAPMVFCVGRDAIEKRHDPELDRDSDARAAKVTGPDDALDLCVGLGGLVLGVMVRQADDVEAVLCSVGETDAAIGCRTGRTACGARDRASAARAGPGGW